MVFFGKVRTIAASASVAMSGSESPAKSGTAFSESATESMVELSPIGRLYRRHKCTLVGAHVHGSQDPADTVRGFLGAKPRHWRHVTHRTPGESIVKVIETRELEQLVRRAFPAKQLFSADAELGTAASRLPMITFVHGGPDPFLDR